MTNESFPPQPSHPEIDLDNQPASEATVSGLAGAMLAKMGADDGWTGAYGDAVVSVWPQDMIEILGEVGYLSMPINDDPNQWRMTDYTIRQTPDGFNIEKFSHYDIEAAGAPTIEEVDSAAEEIRQIFKDEGLNLKAPDTETRIKRWLNVSLDFIKNNNPDNTMEVVTAMERELGLTLVTEAEAKLLADIIAKSVQVVSY